MFNFTKRGAVILTPLLIGIACSVPKHEAQAPDVSAVFGNGGPFSFSAYLDVNPDRTVHGVRLSWGIVCCDAQRYHVERAISPDGPFTEIANYPAEVPDAPQGSYTHPNFLDTEGLAPGQTYYYRVRATSNGSLTSYSSIKGTESLNRGPELPASIDGEIKNPWARMAVKDGVGQGIEIRWSVWWADVELHHVEKATSPEGPFRQVAAFASQPDGPFDWTYRVPKLKGRSGFTYTDSEDLEPGRIYYYRMRVTRNGVPGPYSQVVSQEHIPVSAPLLLQVVPRTSGDLKESSVLVDFSSHDALRTIHIECRFADSEEFERVASIDGSATEWLHAPVDLSGDREVTYRVQAEREGIVSGYSREKSVGLGAVACVPAEYGPDNCPEFCELGCDDGRCAASACPDVCSGGCENNKCTIFCGENDCRDDTLVCPEGMDCEFLCVGQFSCEDSTLVCGSNRACELNCDNCGAEKLICGSGPCHATCPHGFPDKIDCADSSNCNIASECSLFAEVVNEGGGSSFRSCPPACSGGCEDGVCILDRKYGAFPPVERLECPKGMPCRVLCAETNGCPAEILCPPDAECEVHCTGPYKCQDSKVYAFDAEKTTVWCRHGGDEANCPDIVFECLDPFDAVTPPVDASEVELSCAQPPEDSDACPSQCTGGCSGGVCAIDCDARDACEGKVVQCPSGLACEFRCKDCFRSTLVCDSEEECRLVASDTSAGAKLVCGNGACLTTCSNNDWPGLVDCAGSSHCAVEKSCIGTETTNSRSPLSTSGCPPVCNGGCHDNLCMINCTREDTETACLDKSFTCPAGMSCSLLCGALMCRDVALVCEEGQSCGSECGKGRWPKEPDEVDLAPPSTPPTLISNHGAVFSGVHPLSCAVNQQICPAVRIERKPPVDAPPVTCPPTCTGGCAGGVCRIACSESAACRDQVVHCPENQPCSIECTGAASCQESYISCAPNQACEIECTGVGSCEAATIISPAPDLARARCIDGGNCPNISYICLGS